MQAAVEPVAGYSLQGIKYTLGAQSIVSDLGADGTTSSQYADPSSPGVLVTSCAASSGSLSTFQLTTRLPAASSNVVFGYSLNNVQGASYAFLVAWSMHGVEAPSVTAWAQNGLHRSQVAFIIPDTPVRLPCLASALQCWALATPPPLLPPVGADASMPAAVLVWSGLDPTDQCCGTCYFDVSSSDSDIASTITVGGVTYFWFPASDHMPLAPHEESDDVAMMPRFTPHTTCGLTAVLRGLRNGSGGVLLHITDGSRDAVRVVIEGDDTVSFSMSSSTTSYTVSSMATVDTANFFTVVLRYQFSSHSMQIWLDGVDVTVPADVTAAADGVRLLLLSLSLCRQLGLPCTPSYLQ